MEVKPKHNRVKVHSLLSVVSSKPCEPGNFHKLSVMDRVMEPYLLHLVLYYKSDPFSDGSTTLSSQLNNLRISLSDTLNMYLPVTGRLTRGPEDGGGTTNNDWQVKLNDAGVRMLHADVGVTLDEWLRSADADEERDLTVWEDMPADPSFWSPYRIQISNFKCGGLAIGISCNHMQADITSIAQLVKSWSEVHRGLTPRSPIFQLPITSIPPNNSIESPFFIPESSCTDPPSAKVDTVTMKFSGSKIEQALSQIHKQCPDATPFDVLTALFWSRISQYQEPSHNKDDDYKSSLSISLDARAKGKPVIPNDYFGNALHFLLLSLDKSSLKSGLGRVSNHIHQHLMEFKSEDFWSVMSRIEAENIEGNGSFNVYDRVLTCINTEHLADVENGEGLMSSAVFGNAEKPVHASFNVRNLRGQQGLIVVMPSSESGPARNVTITTSEEVIDKLCKDQMILDMEPTVILSGGKRCE